MDFEERRTQLLKILPVDIRKDVFRKMNDFTSIEAIKEYLRVQIELEVQWDRDDKARRGGRDGKVHGISDSKDSSRMKPRRAALAARVARRGQVAPRLRPRAHHRGRRLVDAAGDAPRGHVLHLLLLVGLARPSEDRLPAPCAGADLDDPVV